MSMRSWSEYGYGFALFNGSNLKSVVDFIIENTELDIEGKNALLDSHDEWEIYDVLGESASQVVSDIINNKEGIRDVCGYDSCSDTDQVQMIGIAPSYPWLNQKNMSLDEANNLLCRYADMLGITDAPDYFEASYFG